MALEDDIINRFLQLLEQVEDPPDALANVAQIWLPDGTGTGNTGDIYTKIHQGGDPGSNVTFKLLDFLYATFFGERYTATAAATVNLTAGRYNLVYCLLDQDVEFTITGGSEGQHLYLVLKEDGTGDWEASFGSGFGTIGTMEAAAGEYMIVPLVYDTDNSLWHMLFSGLFVPYTGATKNVDLGSYDLALDDLVVDKTATFDAEVNNTFSGSTSNIFWTSGNKHNATITSDTTLTFYFDPAGPCNLILRIIQGGSGGYQITWPATAKWPDGVPPVLSGDAGDVDIISFYFDGTNYWGTFALALAAS